MIVFIIQVVRNSRLGLRGHLLLLMPKWLFTWVPRLRPLTNLKSSRRAKRMSLQLSSHVERLIGSSKRSRRKRFLRVPFTRFLEFTRSLYNFLSLLDRFLVFPLNASGAFIF